MQSQNVDRKKIDTERNEKTSNDKNEHRSLCEESADYRDNKHKHKRASVGDDQMNNRAAAATWECERVRHDSPWEQ